MKKQNLNGIILFAAITTALLLAGCTENRKPTEVLLEPSEGPEVEAHVLPKMDFASIQTDILGATQLELLHLIGIPESITFEEDLLENHQDVVWVYSDNQFESVECNFLRIYFRKESCYKVDLASLERLEGTMTYDSFKSSLKNMSRTEVIEKLGIPPRMTLSTSGHIGFTYPIQLEHKSSRYRGVKIHFMNNVTNSYFFTPKGKERI